MQIRLRPKASEPLQVTEEEFRANLARDKAARADAPHADGHAADDTVRHEQRPGTRPLERIGHAGRARGRGCLGGVVPRAEDTRRFALGLGALAGGVEEVVGGRERAEVGGARVGRAELGPGEGLVGPFRGPGRRGLCRGLVVRRAPVLGRLGRARVGV